MPKRIGLWTALAGLGCLTLHLSLPAQSATMQNLSANGQAIDQSQSYNNNLSVYVPASTGASASTALKPSFSRQTFESGGANVPSMPAMSTPAPVAQPLGITTGATAAPSSNLPVWLTKTAPLAPYPSPHTGVPPSRRIQGQTSTAHSLTTQKHSVHTSKLRDPRNSTRSGDSTDRGAKG